MWHHFTVTQKNVFFLIKWQLLEQISESAIIFALANNPLTPFRIQDLLNKTFLLPKNRIIFADYETILIKFLSLLCFLNLWSVVETVNCAAVKLKIAHKYLQSSMR